MSQQQQQQHQLQQKSQGGGGGVEELANRLNQMNVYSPQAAATIYCHNNSNTHHRRNPLAGSDLTNIQQPNNLQQQQTQLVAGADGGHDADQAMDESGDFVMAQENHDYQRLIQDNVDVDDRHQQQQQHHHQQQQQQQGNQNKSGSILIATNVDSSVFSDKLTQAEFESLFLAYDSQVSFRYLRSFRRVRLDFSDSYRAELARQNLSSFKIGDTLCRCYVAQIIKAQSQLQQEQEHQQQQQQAAAEGNFALNECYLSSANHLNIPKLTKQFLISPPASPPVGWEPVNEGSPCIDVQLLSAMANLVPGKVHEIHQGNESQPGIYVEVCEDPQFPAQQTGGGGGRISRHIPKTPLPVKPSL